VSSRSRTSSTGWRRSRLCARPTRI
jgi:hypothetical protein